MEVIKKTRKYGMGVMGHKNAKYFDSPRERSKAIKDAKKSGAAAISTWHEDKKPTKGTKFVLYNFTDDILASPHSFDTKEEGEEYKKHFLERFKIQGYYFTSQMQRIPLSELVLEVIPEMDIFKHK